jgi:hypothetical protein
MKKNLSIAVGGFPSVNPTPLGDCLRPRMGDVVGVDNIHHREVCVLLGFAQRCVAQALRDRHDVAILVSTAWTVPVMSVLPSRDWIDKKRQPDRAADVTGFDRGYSLGIERWP